MGKEVGNLTASGQPSPNLPERVERMKAGNTCVVMSNLADLPEVISMGAEPVNYVIVVGEDAEALVQHVA